MRGRSFLRLERVLIFVSLALGLFHTWLGRYAMDPDGMSYLDVGQSFFHRDWANAVNAWWSPLYPWTVGLVVGIANPSPRWEFPLVRVVGAGIFLLTLLAFRFLLHELLEFGRERTSEGMPRDTEPGRPLEKSFHPPNVTSEAKADIDGATLAARLETAPFQNLAAPRVTQQTASNASPNKGAALPEWVLVLLAYPVFLWLALEVETPWYVTPDLAVMACVLLSAGMLLRVRRSGMTWKFVLFGVILGVGYWTKAILFPLGFVTLAAGYFWKRSPPGWRRGMVVAGLAFLVTSAPLIVLLSQQKGRFTFGDSGRLNYAWYVSPRTFWRNWQGEEAGSGKPVHGTRQVMRHPPVFEFDGPVAGTYPPWTDPSYWNEGLQWHFKLKPQLEVLAVSVPSEVRLLLRSRPELVVGIIILALLAGQMWLAGLRELWPLIAISVVGMGLYLPLVENDRYLGGFVAVLFLTLLAAVQLRPEVQRSAAYVGLAVFATMILATADYTVRVATHHLAVPGSGPSSTIPDITAAEQLGRMGARPGDKVAAIMDGTGAYWAHLAKLRIVAEIMNTNHGSREFWNSPEQVQQEVYEAFGRAHATFVVAACPASPPGTPAGWEQIAGTAYCIRRLGESQ